MNDNIIRNGSGYVDLTAYKAIVCVDKEMRKMEEYNRGEIYEYEMSNGLIKTALVVSANYRAKDKFINIIVMTDEPKGDASVEIATTQGPMYADCGMVSFAINDRMGKYLKLARDAEMEKVNAGIAKCLGLEAVEKVVEVIKEVAVPAPAPVHVCPDSTAEIAELKAEAKVYKDLYEKLLAKVMG